MRKVLPSRRHDCQEGTYDWWLIPNEAAATINGEFTLDDKFGRGKSDYCCGKYDVWEQQICLRPRKDLRGATVNLVVERSLSLNVRALNLVS